MLKTQKLVISSRGGYGLLLTAKTREKGGGKNPKQIINLS